VRRRGSGEVLTVEMEPTFFSGRPAPKWKRMRRNLEQRRGVTRSTGAFAETPALRLFFPFSFAFSLQRISAQILCFCVIVFFFGFSLLVNPRSGWTPESDDARLVACFFSRF